MLMADLGAEVIKIEVPGVRDDSRGSTVLPEVPGSYFETNNRGVKSVTLNLEEAEGRAILKNLVAEADISARTSGPVRPRKTGLGPEGDPAAHLKTRCHKSALNSSSFDLRKLSSFSAGNDKAAGVHRNIQGDPIAYLPL